MKTTGFSEIGKQWSAITFGCWQIAPSGGWGDLCTEQEAEASVRTALDCGITAFDTAEGYGDGESERRLGRALGSRKDEVVVISKIWPDAELTLNDYQKRLDASLKALNREYVDVYLVHWPGSYFDSPDKSKKLADIMRSLRDSGKARAIGLSNFHANDLQRLGDSLSDFSINQVPYSLLGREYEGKTRSLCQREGLPYMAFSPTGQGFLAGRFSKEDQNFPARASNRFYQEPRFSAGKRLYEKIQTIARDIGRAPIEIAIAWVLAQPNILTAIVGSRKPDQIREFSKAGDLKLTPETLELLTKASDQFIQSTR
ncbi:MAG: aldo/keto reductase [Candidatus Nitrohelix vancouverensis]|uniref:Aldo/keto reductase n=1 Tax=Candidatus Nitrohelix vancouverensis TaxID=2705534 RepID=A0A7T0C5A4_9BACT|nr:MAG: aldo/keto reductase [Candidatus Nitrohelix vancouverensis]